MRFKTFRLIIGGLVLAAAVGGGALIYSKRSPATSDEDALQPAAKARTTTTAAATAQAGPSTAAVAPTSSGLPLRIVDQKILAELPQNITGDRVKDAFSGDAFKVSLYKDAGESKVNRVKIDLNRNEKWDEKWTIVTVDGVQQIKRQVAPADDENYTEEYRLRGGTWVRK